VLLVWLTMSAGEAQHDGQALTQPGEAGDAASNGGGLYERALGGRGGRCPEGLIWLLSMFAIATPVWLGVRTVTNPLFRSEWPITAIVTIVLVLYAVAAAGVAVFAGRRNGVACVCLLVAGVLGWWGFQPWQRQVDSIPSPVLLHGLRDLDVPYDPQFFRSYAWFALADAYFRRESVPLEERQRYALDLADRYRDGMRGGSGASFEWSIAGMLERAVAEDALLPEVEEAWFEPWAENLQLDVRYWNVASDFGGIVGVRERKPSSTLRLPISLRFMYVVESVEVGRAESGQLAEGDGVAELDLQPVALRPWQLDGDVPHAKPFMRLARLDDLPIEFGDLFRPGETLTMRVSLLMYAEPRPKSFGFSHQLYDQYEAVQRGERVQPPVEALWSKRAVLERSFDVPTIAELPAVLRAQQAAQQRRMAGP